MEKLQLKAALSLLFMTGVTPRIGLPGPRSLEHRLAQFPTNDLPLAKPVSVYWSEQQVPFLEAETDGDLGFALGLVHGHLRLGQIEMMRRVVQGRLSEVVGPAAHSLDHSLRLLALDRAAPTLIERMPLDVRRWLERFVEGLNHYIAQLQELPHEFEVMGITPEPWTPEQIAGIGRLGAPDVNWLVWLSVLEARRLPEWPTIWSEIVERGSVNHASFGRPDGGPVRVLSSILQMFGTRTGSNSFAVAAERSASGGALIASDPHLPIQLPNTWLLAGYRSPSHHAVGLMIPGIPFVAVGRNPWIAWGGTNMRAESSDLVDVSGLPPWAFKRRREVFRTRWWFDETAELRDSPFGPVISDAPLLPFEASESIALRWAGHLPSDELTAMVRVGQARNWQQFMAALDRFSVPAQNMTYADVEGHVGQLMAVHLPARSADSPARLITEPDGPEAHAWETMLSASELPYTFDPLDGYVATANNRPVESDVAISRFFSPADRIQRLDQLLGGTGKIGLEDLKAVQSDIVAPSSGALRELFCGLLDGLEDLPPSQGQISDLLRDWDLRYAEDSPGALAFELVLYHLCAEAFSESERLAYEAAHRLREIVLERLPKREDAASLLAKALAKSVDGVETYKTWGGMHRLQLAHPFAMLPIVGSRYRLEEMPIGGSGRTLMKTAAEMTARRHVTRYGANARHISDLSDPDANYFALLGGQDGWINSSTFRDQVSLWRRGHYLQLPLRPETAKRLFKRHVTLAPEPTA